MDRAESQYLLTSRDLDRAEVVRSASGARAGSLKLRSGDLELDTGLGPEVSDAAPKAYDRSVVLCNPATIKAKVTGDFRIAVASDLHGPARDGLAYATADLQSIAIDVTPGLRLRASEISARILLAKEGTRVTSSIDVKLRDALLEIEGIEPIHLPSGPAPSCLVRPDLLEPLGMQLTVNARLLGSPNGYDRTASVAALRLSFERAALGGLPHAGVVEVGLATVALELERGSTARTPAGWSPLMLQSPARISHLARTGVAA